MGFPKHYADTQGFRRHLCVCVFVLLTVQAHAYRLCGKIEGLKDGRLYLYDNFESRFVDSTQARNGEFCFSGKLPYPTYLAIYDSRPLCYFFIENTENQFIEGNVRNTQSYKLTVSPSHDSWMEASQKLQSLQQTTARHEEQYEYLRQFIRKNPNSSVSALLLFQYTNKDFSIEQKKVLWKLLKPAAQKTKYARFYHEMLLAESRFIGEKIKNYSFKTPNNELVSLSDYRGNYLLIDFWASWCKPCRTQNQELIKIYQHFHPYGFNIFSISWDKDSLTHQQSYDKDGLLWTSVLDVQAKVSAISKQYQIPYIPFNLLLDEKGIIIDKNIKIRELEEKLARYYAKK